MDHHTQHILDTPIWSALATRHEHLRQGGSLARRYCPEMAPFAAVASDTATAWQEFHQLLQPGDQARLMMPDPIEPIRGLQAEQVALLHQMVATVRAPDGAHDPAVLRLSHLDADEMLDLATKTKPGPFSKGTYQMGNYFGIREQGKLIAMAGERMLIDGYVEISAVCVDDEYRGEGLAARLMNVVRRGIEARGDTPFLHVRNDNHAAIALYERLGFEVRRVFRLIAIKRVNLGSAGV